MTPTPPAEVDVAVTPSSGNVFADLNLPFADETKRILDALDASPGGPDESAVAALKTILTAAEQVAAMRRALEEYDTATQMPVADGACAMAKASARLIDAIRSALGAAP